MASANQIRIQTGIDTSAINKELAKLKTSIQDIKKEFDTSDLQAKQNELTKAIEESNKALKMMENSLSSNEEKQIKRQEQIEKIKKRIATTEKTGGSTGTYQANLVSLQSAYDISAKSIEAYKAEIEKEKKDTQQLVDQREQINQKIQAQKQQEQEQLNVANQQIDTLEYQKDVLSALQAERTKDDLDGMVQNPEIYEKNIEILEGEIEKAKEKFGAESDIVKELQKELALQQELKSASEKTFNKTKESSDETKKTTNSLSKNLKLHHDNVSAVSKHNDGLKKGLKLVKTMSLSLLGARSAYLLIRKVINGVLEDNDKLKNTMTGFWGGLSAIFQPAINAMISGLAVVLNYAMSIVKALTQINVFAKAQQKIAKSNSSKSNNLASFDKSEVIKKDSGSDASTNESLLKEIELSEKLQGILESVRAYFAQMKETIATWWDGLDFAPLTSALGSLGDAFTHLGSVIGDSFMWILEDVLLPFASWTIEEGAPALVELLASAFEFLATALELALPYLKQIWEDYLQPIAEAIGDELVIALDWLKEKLDGITEWMKQNPQDAGIIVTTILAIVVACGVLIPIIEKVIEWFNKTKDPITSATTDFTGFLDSMGKAVEIIAILGGLYLVLTAFAEVLDSIGGLLDTMNQNNQSALDIFTLMLAVLVPLGVAVALLVAFAPEIAVGLGLIGVALIPISLTLPTLLEALTNFIAVTAPNLVTIINTIGLTIRTLGTTISNVFKTAKDLILGVLEEVGNYFEYLGEWVLDVFDKVGDNSVKVLDAIGDNFEKIGKTICEVIDTLVKAFQTSWLTIKDIVNSILGAIEGFVNGLIRGINAVIDALNSIHVDIPEWVPGFGGKSFGINLPHVSEITIPKLAEGAVIQPNQPFMAMLGDQRRGTNIETPESLLRQVVSEESGASNMTLNISTDSTSAEFVRWLKFELNNEDKRKGLSLVQGV